MTDNLQIRGDSTDMSMRVELAERALAHRELIARQARQTATELERRIANVTDEQASERARAAEEAARLLSERDHALDELERVRRELARTQSRRVLRIVDRVAHSVRDRLPRTDTYPDSPVNRDQ